MHLARALPGLSLLLLPTFVACGGSTLDLPPAASEGRQVFLGAGCAGCHGSTGEGGVGPALTGLLGSGVELSDGTIVVADEAYVRESILDPAAKRVAGYALQMPANDLSDQQVDQILAYLRALGGES